MYTNIHTYIRIYIPVYTHTSRGTNEAPSGDFYTFTGVSPNAFKQTRFWQEKDLRLFRIVTRQECEECEFFSFLVPVTSISAALNWLGVPEQTILKFIQNQPTTIKSMSVHDANENLTISNHSNK